jgi:hypothetical protein
VTRIEHFHQHIDNGGISVDVDYDFDAGHTCITFNTRYHGYPDVAATLRTWGQAGDGTCIKWGQARGGDPDFLRELGLMFLRASEKIKPIIEAEAQKHG